MKYPSFPEKRYSIIYADPPWSYNDALVNSAREKLTFSRASNHYPTLSMSELSAMPVSDISAKNCLLFMWVSSPNLKDCIDVGESWGFKFKQVAFVWEKQLAVTGYYTMTRCELCLVFKKGRIPRPRGAMNTDQFLSCRRGRHSEKPLEIKHRILKMFPVQSKIELFARPGLLFVDSNWDYWGNEILNGGL